MVKYPVRHSLFSTLSSMRGFKDLFFRKAKLKSLPNEIILWIAFSGALVNEEICHDNSPIHRAKY